MNTNEYIKTVLSHVKNKAFIASIEQELRDHIADREEYYEQIGYDTEISLQKAMEHIGNPDDVGEQMNRLHSSKARTTAQTIFYFIALALWAVFIFAADNITFVSRSSVEYIIRSNFIIVLLFFGITLFHSLSFVISIDSRISRQMSSVGYFGLFVNICTYASMPESFRYTRLDLFSAFDSESLFYALMVEQQVQYAFIFYSLAVMLLTSLIGYFMSCEFKAFETGTAKMSVIHSLEKYKRLLYFLMLPGVVYILFFIIQFTVGAGYGYFI